MEQFNLEKYLENPTRKVVTRRGNPVRIICTDRKHGEDELPIVFLEECLNGEFLLACTKDGKGDYHYDSQYDLFFADEEEELTEFEKAIKKLIESCCNEVEEANITNAGAKEISSNLLDLARKELQPEIDKEIDKAYKNIDTIVYDNGYKQGQYEIMEDLPKWRKANKETDFEERVLIYEDDYICYDDHVYIDDYYIERNELKKLPKE